MLTLIDVKRRCNDIKALKDSNDIRNCLMAIDLLDKLKDEFIEETYKPRIHLYKMNISSMGKRISRTIKYLKGNNAPR